MFEKDMATHLILTKQNASHIHPEAFKPSREFTEWLDSQCKSTKQPDNKESE